MCGIVGYIGKKQAPDVLIQGLKRLEYRGYDSVGVSVIDGTHLQTVKVKGRVADLVSALEAKPLQGTVGIAHTRWATHGVPSEVNAHPHLDCAGAISVVHNGIIENFAALKIMLEQHGHHFVSQTDSEVLAHLIEHNLKDNTFEQAVVAALQLVEGAYGIVVMNAAQPDMLIVAKKGSPLVIGVGDGEYIIGSDVSAVVEYTKQVIYLEDNEIAVITPTTHQVSSLIDQTDIIKKIEEINWDLQQIEKGGAETFMLKEILEQPQSVANALRGRIDGQGNVHLGGLESVNNILKSAQRFIIIGCGTSWHAGLVGEYMIEDFARVPVEVEYASEFRYRDPVLGPADVVIAISQSGETADTLAALQLAKSKGATTIGICNVVGSSIARSVDAGLYLHAGPEIGVASTKAFTAQLTVLTLLAAHVATLRETADKARVVELLQALQAIPAQLEIVLSHSEKIKELVEDIAASQNAIYLGRGYNFPVALEGALKLKEISYIHAEGYPAAEMKHGPIALIDQHMPVVFIAPRDAAYEKAMSNMQEINARGGRIIAITTEGNEGVGDIAEMVITIPKTHDALTPILSTIPLQLMAYHIARYKDCDVDKPRNLAKSVTVE